MSEQFGTFEELRSAQDAEAERRRDLLNARAIEQSQKQRLEEYRARGIDPVYADPEKTIVVSLAMMLHNGWTIEDWSEGRQMLVAPRAGEQ